MPAKPVAHVRARLLDLVWGYIFDEHWCGTVRVHQALFLVVAYTWCRSDALKPLRGSLSTHEIDDRQPEHALD